MARSRYSPKEIEDFNLQSFGALASDIVATTNESPYVERVDFGYIAGRERLYTMPHLAEPSLHPRISRWGEAKRTFLQLTDEQLGVSLHLGEVATFNEMSNDHFIAQFVAAGSPRWEKVFQLTTFSMSYSFVGDPRDKQGDAYVPIDGGGTFGAEYDHHDWGLATPEEIAALRFSLRTAEPISGGEYMQRREQL